MGLSHSPRIVTDGLVLCLDAANKRSYPGAGTTWTDLTANKNNGTLTNMDGSNFSNDGAGSLIFDGTDEYIDLSSLSTSLFSDGNASLFCLLKSYTSSANSQGDSGIFGFGGHADNNHYTWSNGSAYFDTFRSNRVASNNIIDESIDKAKPHALCITVKSGGSWKLYQVQGKNLILRHSTSAGTFSMLDAQKNIGYSDSTSYMFRGSFYNFLMYNKELSVEEIRQNYLATKGRFQ